MMLAHITLPLLCSFTELFICVKPDERIINHVIRKGENTEEFQVFDETLRFDCLTVLLRPFIHLRKIFDIIYASYRVYFINRDKLNHGNYVIFSTFSSYQYIMQEADYIFLLLYMYCKVNNEFVDMAGI